MIGALIIVEEKRESVDFKNHLEEDYEDFFRRYFDLADKMTEFREK